MESLPSHSFATPVIQIESRLPISVMGIGISLKSSASPSQQRQNIFAVCSHLRVAAATARFCVDGFSQLPCIHNNRPTAPAPYYVSLCKRAGARRNPCPSEFAPLTRSWKVRLRAIDLDGPAPRAPPRRALRRASSDRCRRPVPCQDDRRRGRRPSGQPR